MSWCYVGNGACDDSRGVTYKVVAYFCVDPSFLQLE